MKRFSRPLPQDVFTPRAKDVNASIYVARPQLERRLEDALLGDKYLIVHGESGNGKTWLYKSVLGRLGYQYEVLNLANATVFKGLMGAFERKLADIGYQEERESGKTVDGGFRPGGIGGGVTFNYENSAYTSGPFVLLMKAIRSRAGKSPAALILDNLEQITSNQDILREVAALIISADEELIADQKVKIILVGTPTNLRDLISQAGNAGTISNRLVEIPEVARMSSGEASEVIRRGFVDQLNYKFEIDQEAIIKRICWETDRIAQQIHEFCLKIALEAERTGLVISDEVVDNAREAWLSESCSADLAVVQGVMNSRDTKVGRKNQVVYCLGLLEAEDFHHSDIEKLVRETFSVPADTKLNIPQSLAGFANESSPLIRRNPKGATYRFVSPKLRMAIRASLELNVEMKVVRRRSA